jgi:hypothetical protein
MRPGHIQVFDGLRITTEHIDHLQSSLHAAVQDIREILGLGQVHAGFEVVPEDGRSVTVQPGLAFDFQRNRVVCEQPKVLEVTFEAEQDLKYVCAKYEQVEDGIVEGQPTLFWDSCSVLVRDTLPEPRENLVPIVALARRDDGEGFDVVALPSGVEGQEIEGPLDAEEAVTEETEAIAEAEEAEAAVEEVAPAGGETQGELPPEEAAPAEKGAPPPEPEPWRWPVQQGVVRLGSGPEGTSLRAVLWEPLSRKLSQGGDGAGDGEMQFTLAQQEIPLGFPPASLTCQTLLRTTVRSAADSAEGELGLQATAQGEATFVDRAVAQFGISTIQSPWHPEPGGGPPWRSELTERGIAVLSFADESPAGGGDVWELLECLHLLIKIDRTEDHGCNVACKLVWEGGVGEEIVRTVEEREPHLMWESAVAWKAMGEPHRQQN